MKDKIVSISHTVMVTRKITYMVQVQVDADESVEKSEIKLKALQQIMDKEQDSASCIVSDTFEATIFDSGISQEY